MRWGGGDVGGGGGCAREVVAIVTSIAACAEQLVLLFFVSAHARCIETLISTSTEFWGFVLFVLFACLSLW